MRISRPGMFVRLNGFIALALLIYFSRWLFSSTTEGTIVTPLNPSTLHVIYQVDGNLLSGSFMRNGVPTIDKTVTIRFLNSNPRVAVVDSFLGLWAEPLAWWGVFLLASGLLLLTGNTVFSKNTQFFFRKTFPYIWMEEYFPASYYHNPNKEPQQAKQTKQTHQKRIS